MPRHKHNNVLISVVCLVDKKILRLLNDERRGGSAPDEVLDGDSINSVNIDCNVRHFDTGALKTQNAICKI
ncbi:hypothetical protein D3C85_1655020 [compost metagenome]